MTYRIDADVAREIANHARSRYPDEASGLIAGRHQRISFAVALRNVAQEPQKEFAIEPAEQLRALKSIDAEGLRWIGVYHSHPFSAPIPSAEDLDSAHDYGLLQLIVSLRGGKPAFKLWQLHEFGADPLDLHFDGERLPDVSDPRLTQQQWLAMLIAGALAVLLVLVIAFSLLPPAPDLSVIR